jgi:hypothetical protein
MPDSSNNELPESATGLIALARVAHRNGERQVERAAVDKLARDFGIEVHFPCSESVDRDLERAAKQR